MAGPGGFSSRKLSTFTAIAVSVWITIQSYSAENLINALEVWLLFALLCMGLVTFSDIVGLKTGRTEEKPQTQDEKSKNPDADPVIDGDSGKSKQL